MSEGHGNTLNYDYVLSRAGSWSSTVNPRVLDYGCGWGDVVALGVARGIDVFGVDTFEGNYQAWQAKTPVDLQNRIKKITDGRIPFDDQSFDAVISNQVFEHIRDPLPAFREIARVLKPGGIFLALFPDETVWFEGHIGLYFPHWLRSWPSLQMAYLTACHRLGFGYYRDGGPQHWLRIITNATFYHRKRDVQSWWSDAFGGPPESMAHDWMLFRISHSRRFAPFLNLMAHRWMRPLLVFVCHARTGLILKAQRAL